ncbi:MAG: DUF4383 domain-containing protein [Actinomycetota bacterium]
MTMTATTKSSTTWNLARWFLLIFAIVHLPLGVAGLVADRSFPLGTGATRAGDPGHVLGVFETNGWHSLGALLLGVLAAAALIRPGRERPIALAIGALHVWLVLSLVLWDPSNFLIASNDADQIVHASSAVGGLVSGLLMRR